MKNIKLNNEIGINLPILMESKLAALANSGGGKSWLIRRIVEQTFGQVQIIIIDPEGEYGNLRKEFDFVLAGEGGEVAPQVHIAAKLAERLMEMKASAIIDLYELLPQDRKRFVRLFLDSLMNLPKTMQTDMLLIIDEAHVFAPEGKPSEASTSMEALASQVRKRNIGVIFATQRIAKFSKDVLAECNNKMIGRMNLDIDRKRAGEELGFTSKEQVLSLRNLKAGEFHMFGPAISDEIIFGKIGDVKVPPPKRGQRTVGAVPPSANVKKLIAQLSDLPAEVKKEVQTMAELKKEMAHLKMVNTNLLKHPYQKDLSQEEIRKIIEPHLIAFRTVENGYKNLVERWENYTEEIRATVNNMTQSLQHLHKHKPSKDPGVSYKEIPKMITVNPDDFKKVKFTVNVTGMEKTPGDLGRGEKTILNAIAQNPEGMTTEHIAVLTGYKNTSRRTYLQKLQSSGYIKNMDGNYHVTEQGMVALGDSFKPLPTGGALQEHLMRTLPEGEKRVLSAILMGGESPTTREQIEESTGYKTTSVRTYLQKLSARKVIKQEGGMISISEKLL